ncbi:intraflagellar transport-associated protein [Cygnus olor]|uniref:intraflagellar transport-associated protein n=1 Tax=Cygnus olor TaxID=8869 RepID=UPI001ADE4888|nr:intraflagellar transport-associated protein [Cygnus olor]XP_040414810.1 intraflagellar transport-associated protein [Cygnus olor]XP_040414811.1 intraflagellar transport-associated protein [Cygnus olor]XP_040414812.1 intraflagellar transport-associated protein [Cygnus olor]XP_040414813.1 intraflagellar transport-associated protein [Cygnus olor]XP_040414814.1 intraflagellar transport-associated protein [Cygnus olor]
MEEQSLNNSILDQFINSHEQSYDEFLNSFTYLLKEEEGKTIQGRKNSLRKTFSTSEFSNRDKQDGSPGRSKEISMCLPPQTPNENEAVMNENWKAGGSDGNDLGLSERAKVNKYLDTGTDEETCSAGSLVLPGQVEQTVTCCTPAFDKPVQRKFGTLLVPQPLDSKTQELLGDDVQPFLLDEEFDYDNVALTPKFSEAELKAIIELSEEKKRGQMSSPAGAED